MASYKSALIHRLTMADRAMADDSIVSLLWWTFGFIGAAVTAHNRVGLLALTLGIVIALCLQVRRAKRIPGCPHFDWDNPRQREDGT